MTDDRSRDVSTALTEVRTVHSRALSALNRLDSEWSFDTYYDPDVMAAEPQQSDYPDRDSFLVDWRDWHDRRHATAFKMADQDHDEMIDALERVVELLDRWEKKGRRR
jgi:hypothetical protein